MKKIFIAASTLAGATPLVAFATDTNVFDILGIIARVLSVVTPILVALAVVYFIWQVIQYTLSGDDKKKAEAKKNIPTALVGLFVMVAFWGILTVVTNTLGIGPEQLDTRDIPCIENPQLGIYCNR
jgi:ABC-type xylose transport system permease subunit